jgi:hypothetical protein
MDRRRDGDELTDDELSDLEQHEEDEKAPLKAENPPNSDAGKESMSFKGEDPVSVKEIVVLSKASQSPSPPSTNDNSFT